MNTKLIYKLTSEQHMAAILCITNENINTIRRNQKHLPFDQNILYSASCHMKINVTKPKYITKTGHPCENCKVP